MAVAAGHRDVLCEFGKAIHTTTQPKCLTMHQDPVCKRKVAKSPVSTLESCKETTRLKYLT